MPSRNAAGLLLLTLLYALYLGVEACARVMAYWISVLEYRADVLRRVERHVRIDE